MQGIQSALVELLGEPVEVTDVSKIGGGCISDAAKVCIRTRESAKTLFVKYNVPAFLDNFQCEAEGLKQLSDTGAVGVPDVISVGAFGGQAWLVLQHVDQSTRQSGFFELFGVRLAELHRVTRGQAIGWDRDNYLGAAKQPNESVESWPDFVAQHRIGYQLRWAVDQGLRDSSLERDCESIIAQMSSVLDGRADQTSLLHGDLWSGNYLCDQSGGPVVIDPAVYRGCREAEFGMLKLFGSCPAAFYESYQSVWPMPEGWQRRSNVYVLYHLMNHLNLFGTGYIGQCKSMASIVLRE